MNLNIPGLKLRRQTGRQRAVKEEVKKPSPGGQGIFRSAILKIQRIKQSIQEFSSGVKPGDQK